MQVSFRSKPLVHLFSDVSLTRLKYSVPYFLPQKQRLKMAVWVLGSTGTTLMLAWDPKLVCATLTGIGLMGLVYRFQTVNWQRRWLYWREFVNSSQGKLAIAVSSGSLGIISSYIALSIWSNAENRWLATGLILQGFGTFLILGLLSWQLFDSPRKKQDAQYQEWVSQLTDVNVLKRLIAVENLSNLIEKKQLTPIQAKQLRGYFRLMLNQETEIIVRQAVLQCCQVLDNPQHLATNYRN
ncbi:MAG: hypothetical protein WBM62_02040 [Crocosphaera sp.]|jgi:hypothetical protein